MKVRPSHLGAADDDEEEAFQQAVAAEDRALLQRMHRKAVPLDLAAEYHSMADRITLEMRRTMRDLVAAAAQ